MFYSTTYESPIGMLTLANKGDDLVGLWMEGQKYHGASIPEEMVFEDNRAVFQKVKAWLDRYFDGQNPPLAELSLAPIGSDFRQAAWDILCKIPYGEVTTYGSIAQQMAKARGKERMSSQAVGGAVGHNPIAVIIPCHRVVGATGSLIGYAGGIAKKIQLLKLEGVDTSQFFTPTKGTAL